MLTVRLSETVENQLKTLAELEGTGRSEIIRKAVSEYFFSHVSERHAYDLGKDLFGRFSSNTGNLSSTYKKRIREKIRAKCAH